MQSLSKVYQHQASPAEGRPAMLPALQAHFGARRRVWARPWAPPCPPRRWRPSRRGSAQVRTALPTAHAPGQTPLQTCGCGHRNQGLSLLHAWAHRESAGGGLRPNTSALAFKPRLVVCMQRSRPRRRVKACPACKDTPGVLLRMYTRAHSHSNMSLGMQVHLSQATSRTWQSRQEWATQGAHLLGSNSASRPHRSRTCSTSAHRPDFSAACICAAPIGLVRALACLLMASRHHNASQPDTVALSRQSRPMRVPVRAVQAACDAQATTRGELGLVTSLRASISSASSPSQPWGSCLLLSSLLPNPCRVYTKVCLWLLLH